MHGVQDRFMTPAGVSLIATEPGPADAPSQTASSTAQSPPVATSTGESASRAGAGSLARCVSMILAVATSAVLLVTVL